jgi:hypothetical protein
MMFKKPKFMIILVAILLSFIAFFANRNVSEAQSARFFLKWTVDCDKGEQVLIKPRYDLAFKWVDPYLGKVETIVPLAMSCKTSTGEVNKICKGYYLTRASQIDPMNKTHVACYAVP